MSFCLFVVFGLSGEAKDCISQAKRMAERMTATGKERSFCLVVLDGAQ